MSKNTNIISWKVNSSFMCINKPKVYKEMNWLNSNHLGLQKAQNKYNPLYEGLKFLAIFTFNFKRYFEVYVAHYKHLKYVNKVVRQGLSLKPRRKLIYRN